VRPRADEILTDAGITCGGTRTDLRRAVDAIPRG